MTPSFFSGGAAFSTARDDWETPRYVFEPLKREFGFEVDVCASAANAKCARFFTQAADGLAQQWLGSCWANPPYAREIGRWMAKAVCSANEGATVVCLVPARTDTLWWHTYVMPRANEVRLVKGRIRFVGSTSSAPFPSAIVVYRPQHSPVSFSTWTPPAQTSCGKGTSKTTGAQ